MGEPLIDKPKINCAQKCLIEGGPNASCMENSADCILSFPRCMWGRYNIYGQHQCNCTSCIENGMNMANQKNVLGSVGVGLCCSPIYITLSLLAAPFALIGMPLKLCILCNDDDASAYNNQIESAMQSTKESILDENQRLLSDLNTKILTMQGELNRANNFLSDYEKYNVDDIDDSKDSRELQVAKLRIRIETLSEELASIRQKRTDLELRLSELS